MLGAAAWLPGVDYLILTETQNREAERQTTTMKIAELENRIDLVEYLTRRNYPLKGIGSGNFRINPCPVCGRHDHFTIYPETNSYSSFSECCKGGSVYKFLIEVEGMGEAEAYKRLQELANVYPDNPRTDKPMLETAPGRETASGPEEPPEHMPEESAGKQDRRDYTDIILKLYAEQSKEDRDYFIRRGISPEVIDRYKLSIGDIRRLGSGSYGRRAILPVWIDGKVVHWNARSLEDNPKCKYLKASGQSVYFNADHARTAAENEIIIITEGEFDALSLESVGVKAIALGGVNNYRNFVESCPRKDLLFLTAFDNDEQGQREGGPLKISIPAEYKDINEWKVAAGADAFKKGITEQIEKRMRPHNLHAYLQNQLTADIRGYQEFKDRKSGFSNLDEETRIYPGLYVIGGLSSVGKTTFIHQMADQMAAMGDHVLFFSLEMSTLELVTKSLARLASRKDQGYKYDDGLVALQIRLSNIPKHKRPLVKQAVDDYAPISKRFSIIEGNFDTDVTAIRNYIDKYIRVNQVKPLVIIDYLQIVPGRPEDRGDKERLDGVVTELKRISRDYNITVIAVSSLNRNNYLTPIDFESFKESGGIEYTADVIWGLQLEAIHDDIFNKNNKTKEKREIINKAKAETPRHIELVCLKNRNGVPYFSCYFDYYSKYDTYVAMASSYLELDSDQETTRE